MYILGKNFGQNEQLALTNRKLVQNVYTYFKILPGWYLSILV